MIFFWFCYHVNSEIHITTAHDLRMSTKGYFVLQNWLEWLRAFFESSLKKSHVCLDLQIYGGLRNQEAGKGKFWSPQTQYKNFEKTFTVNPVLIVD